MYFVKTPQWLKKLYSGYFWDIPSDGKVLYLTFDDGPTQIVTPWVLDTLLKFHAKATFFCLGKNAERYPEIFERIKKLGHKIGNHTYSHLNGWKTANKEYFDDIELGQTYLNAKLFRPPYGKITHFQLTNLRKKFKIVMWDVLSRDYDTGISKTTCYNNVIKNVKPGSVVVFHDSVKASQNLYFALPAMLEYFTAQGYKFRAIKE